MSLVDDTRRVRTAEPVGSLASFTAACTGREAIERFACFGGSCTLVVQGSGPAGTASQAAARARRRLEFWHRQFSRFDPGSELSALNRDPAETVPVSPMMSRFVQSALWMAGVTGGLVDPTLVEELELAGYSKHLALAPGCGPCSSDEDRPSVTISPPEALARPEAPRAAEPRADGRWRQVYVDANAGTVTRPVGVRLDSGGVGKGLFGDVLATLLDGHLAFAVDAAGDVRFGGSGRLVRAVQVAGPFGDGVVHTFELARGAAATSGIGRRAWRGPDGRPAHHLLDPSTGRPAFTGVIQATALAPTGVAAEALSKAALLSGPQRAADWLCHGGVLVYDDGRVQVIEPLDVEVRR